MFAKVFATVILTACASNTAREIVTVKRNKEEKHGLLKHGIKCATLGILATAAMGCATSIFETEE